MSGVKPRLRVGANSRLFVFQFAPFGGAPLTFAKEEIN